MDDEKIGAQGLQQFISLLREMNEETRIAYLKECEYEEKNGRNDGWVQEGYRKYLEAAKYV